LPWSRHSSYPGCQSRARSLTSSMARTRCGTGATDANHTLTMYFMKPAPGGRLPTRERTSARRSCARTRQAGGRLQQRRYRAGDRLARRFQHLAVQLLAAEPAQVDRRSEADLDAAEQPVTAGDADGD